MYATDQGWRPVMPIGWQQQETSEEVHGRHLRTGNDVTMDELAPATQHKMLVAEKRANLTGNREPRNHSIRVPTAAGEHMRG